MTAGHKAIDWGKSTAAALPKKLRADMGELWKGMLESEHRSAGIFATFVLDLMGAGAPREVLSVACRAALDEVRHAELSAKVAKLYTGRDESPEAGIPRVFDDPDLSLETQALRQALFLSVGAETYSSVSLAAQHDAADDPVVRDVLAVILADEVFHARLGWAWFAARVEDKALAGPTRAILSQHVVPVFDDLVRGLFGDPASIAAPTYRGRELALARSHGYAPARDSYALFHDTLRDLWIPGLAALGVDASPLTTRYPKPTW